MAKYSRFDPRNKKRGKHKSQSENKELRIREVVSDTKQMLNEVMYDDEYDYEGYEEQQLNGQSVFRDPKPEKPVRGSCFLQTII